MAVAEVVGQGDKAGKDFLRHLDAGELLLPGFRIANQGRHIQAEVAHEREGMGRIHCQWREHGKDF